MRRRLPATEADPQCRGGQRPRRMSATSTSKDFNARIWSAIRWAAIWRSNWLGAAAQQQCVFAPGGFWASGDGLRERTLSRALGGAGIARLMRPIMPLVLKSPRVRRLMFQDGACHGDRISAHRGVEIFDDFLGCTVANEVFSTDEEQIAPLDPLPCPVTVAWSEKDEIVPVTSYGPNARARLPQATFVTLPDVGHDPMVDDPELVARTILSVTTANAPQV